MSERVYPVVVEGTPIAHLAWSVLDETGAGYRAICPAAALITRPLRLIVAGSSWVWCGACRSWAEAAGVPLPMPCDGPLEEASTDPPAVD